MEVPVFSIRIVGSLASASLRCNISDGEVVPIPTLPADVIRILSFKPPPAVPSASLDAVDNTIAVSLLSAAKVSVAKA